MTPQAESHSSGESFDEGYYYDEKGGVVVELTVEGETVVSRPLDGWDVTDKFPTSTAPSERDYRKVPDIAVEQPKRVAQAVYNHGYENEPPVFVDDERCGVAAFEFIDTIIQIRVLSETGGNWGGGDE